MATVVLDKIKQALDESSLKYRVEAAKTPPEVMFFMEHDGVNMPVRIQGSSNANQMFYVFYAYKPDKIPEAKRLGAAEVICRLNNNFKMGNFELDFNDGEVRLKMSAAFASAFNVVVPLLKVTLEVAFSTATRGFRALDYFVLHDSVTPEAAVSATASGMPSAPPAPNPGAALTDEQRQLLMSLLMGGGRT